MKRKLFTFASVVSLLLCTACAWSVMNYFVFWRHGVIELVSGREQVVLYWFSRNWRPSARAERTLGSDACVLEGMGECSK